MKLPLETRHGVNYKPKCQKREAQQLRELKKGSVTIRVVKRSILNLIAVLCKRLVCT